MESAVDVITLSDVTVPGQRSSCPKWRLNTLTFPPTQPFHGLVAVRCVCVWCLELRAEEMFRMERSTFNIE